MSTSNGIHHETNSVHNPMDADIDALYSWFPPPASLCCLPRITVGTFL